jgi:hypothetical protein
MHTCMDILNIMMSLDCAASLDLYYGVHLKIIGVLRKLCGGTRSAQILPMAVMVIPGTVVLWH